MVVSDAIALYRIMSLYQLPLLLTRHTLSFHKDDMLKSYPTRYPTSGVGARVIRLTVNQEAVLQEQFNRWPRAPHTADVVLLAAETGLSEADVEVSKYV